MELIGEGGILCGFKGTQLSLIINVGLRPCLIVCKLLFKRRRISPLKLAQCLLYSFVISPIDLLTCKCACLATFTTNGEDKTSQLSLVVSANHTYANASRAPPAKEQHVWTRYPLPVA